MTNPLTNRAHCHSGMRRAAAILSTMALAAAGLLIPLTVPASAAAPDRIHPAHALSDALISELADPAIGAQTGVYVHDMTAAEPAFAWQSGTPRVLAAIAKLYTAGAVLDRFGTEGTLTTSLVGTGSLENGVIDGDLYLVGGGDPTLGTAAMIEGRYDGTGATVEELVDEAVAAGLSRVTGDVLGDGSRFDDQRDPTGGLSGLTFDRGIRTSAPQWAAEQLVAELERRGIVVDGSPRTGVAPDGVTRVSDVASPPMSRLVQLMNKPGDNFFAEMLVKNLSAADGDQGTTADGVAKVMAFARGLGANVALADGSGLSSGDVATPEAVVALLDGVQEQDQFPAFLDSLPIAGIDGTLASRMVGTSAAGVCQARTGSLSGGVSTLAGYCEAPGGHRLGFSILMNDLGVGSAAARDAQDRMTAAIAEYSSAVAEWASDGRGAPGIQLGLPGADRWLSSGPGESIEVSFTANRNWPYDADIRATGTDDWISLEGSGRARFGLTRASLRLPDDIVPGQYDLRVRLLTPGARPRPIAEHVGPDVVEVVTAATELTRALETELADPDIASAAGAYVYDLTEDEPVFATQSDVPRILASNTKLFTAAAVLETFGSEGTLTTSLEASAPLDDGVVAGDLYLVGGGDPTFGTAAVIESRYDGTGATVEELVDEAVAAGLTRVEGDVLGDGSRFDDERNPTGGLSGLTFDRGVRSSPPQWAAEQLVTELERRGVVVAGTAQTGAAPEGTTVLSDVDSPAMSRLVQLMNKPSDNFFAEMLVKNLSAADGDQGTTADGVAEVMKFAHGLGADAELSNGSGLTSQNQATPEAVVTMLGQMQEHGEFPAFSESLPIAGEDGTLASRMVGTPAHGVCQAKTGTLSSGVSTLSGYCQAPGGHRIAFSILMNELRTGSGPARAAQDRMTGAIATYSSAVAP